MEDCTAAKAAGGLSVLYVGSEVTLIDFHFMRCSGAENVGAFEAFSSARATMIRGSVTVSPRYHLRATSFQLQI